MKTLSYKPLLLEAKKNVLPSNILGKKHLALHFYRKKYLSCSPGWKNILAQSESDMFLTVFLPCGVYEFFCGDALSSNAFVRCCGGGENSPKKISAKEDAWKKIRAAITSEKKIRASKQQCTGLF
jgi:hypothetical protein